MKRILIALALIASVQVAGAQSKSAASAMKAVETAKTAAENPKKAAQPATWVKLGKAYLDAYSVPAGDILVGASKQELSILLRNERAKSSETVEIQGQLYTKDVYNDKNLYFNENGQLAVIEVTRPLVENALDKSLEAYLKAASLDPKGSKSKDIIAGQKQVAEKFQNEAYDFYTFGKFAEASKMFEASAKASAAAPNSQIDTVNLYNAAFTAWTGGDGARAKGLFEQCLANGYAYKDGEVYAKLAEIAAKEENQEAQQKYLEDGFAAFPSSQSILVGLINFYIATGKDTNRLFSLLDQAKANEPGNVSLYYVEGNVYDKLGNEEKAIEAYRKCAQVNPEYEWGYVGEGLLLYNKSMVIAQEADNEMDDAKYAVLLEKYEATIKSCIEPFEKALEITKDESLKGSLAQYLKSACYRFREDPTYSGKYEKYSKMAE